VARLLRDRDEAGEAQNEGAGPAARGQPAAAAEASRPSGAIRPARAGDLPAIIALDTAVTGLAKEKYWRDQLARCVRRRGAPPIFLVATSTAADAALLGFVLGEVRAWEFGSEPCGWVYAIQSPIDRLGAALLDAMALFLRLRSRQVRTMARDDRLLLRSSAPPMTTGST
jgi:hypothetical protein